MKRCLLFLLLLAQMKLSAVAQSALPSFVTDSLDAYITQGLKDWNVPGLAIAIVKDGKTVVMKGYGVRDIKTQQPVDENTLFQIASNSKLFTGTAIAQLDVNRKLSLDDKVSKYLKDFALYDKNSTELVTIRDLLSHRIGTKTFQADFVFWNSNLSRQAIMRRMKLMKPVNPFRQNFGYCNSCFVTAGEIIPIVSGKPWEVYVYDSLLTPLEMKNSFTLSNHIPDQQNVAKPYTTGFTGTLTELPYDQIDNFGAAGGIASNVKDLTHWLQMQLDSGRYNGRTVVSWEALQKTRNINTITRSSKHPQLPSHMAGYGLGVFTMDYNGRQVYYHTGGADGFVTSTCFVPEERLGITILTNNDNQNFFESLRYQILDAFLQVPYVNRSQGSLKYFKEGEKEQIEKVSAWKARARQAKVDFPLDAYAGNYENELYGPVEITVNEDRSLKIDYKGHNNLSARLEYMGKDEWLLSYNNAAYGIFAVKFVRSGKKVVSIDLRVNDFIDYDAYTFTRK